MTWEEKEKIRNLIVALHVECDYYSALDGLCELVDWKSFKHEAGLYSSEMMNDWVRSKVGTGRIQVEELQEVQELTPPAPVVKQPSRYKLKKAAFIGPPPPPKKRGWPKGKLRGPMGPRKPKVRVLLNAVP